MKPLRLFTPLRSRRLAYASLATTVVAGSLAFAIPTASATAFTAGNLLVSTSVYNDVPSITPGSTVLPFAPSSFTISNVTWASGSPGTATITTAKSSGTPAAVTATANGFNIGQTVLIAGVGGATGVNGSWTVSSKPSSTTFGITVANPGTYTAGTGGVTSQQLGITNVTWSSGTATITTAGNANKYAVGQTVVISGVTTSGASVNGTATVLATPAPSKTAFGISVASTTGTYTPATGTVAANIALADSHYPEVFNNDAIDPNFGITEPIVLDQIPASTSLVTPSSYISSTTVPNSDTAAADQLVTSFSSKSELALNQSTDGQDVSFMGYHAPTGAIDVSNSNTPIEQDPSNTDLAGSTPLNGFYRDAAAMDGSGNFQFTETGAYPGNNGRAAVLNPANNTLFFAGNAGNGGTPTYQGVVVGAGSQIAPEASTSQATQDAALAAPTPYGDFNITQLGDAADKATKDNNFRGLTQYNGSIYMTKGSGSNGINTVYFVDPSGTACPSGSTSPGVGVPQSGASLPAASSWSGPTYNTSNSSQGLSTANPGLAPTNMCILKGFSTTLASAASGVMFPFGLWFANPTTLYVADEGNGAGGTGDTTGGLQKWVLNTSTNTWSLAYTLQTGLGLLTPYSVNSSPAGINGGAAGQTYPTGNNTGPGGTGTGWAPATDGLRNIIGRDNADGTVTIWGTTSTISGSGDQGTDPNQVVAVTDTVSATTAGSESFSQVLAPTDGIVYRGVSFTPTTSVPNVLPEVPWAPLIPLSAVLLGGGYFWLRRRRYANAVI